MPQIASRNPAALIFLLALALLGGACKKPPVLTLTSPVHGEFTNASLVTVSGQAFRYGNYQSFTVNGVTVPAFTGNNWSVDVPVSAVDVFNPIVAELTLASGGVLRQHVTIVVGDGVTTGFVPISVAPDETADLRISATGLDQISPIVEGLSGGALDVGSLLGAGGTIDTGQQGITATLNEVTFGGFGLDVDPAVSGLDTTISIDDLYIDVRLDGIPLIGECTLEITTTLAEVQGNFDLQPDAGDPSRVDVNLVSSISVTLSGFLGAFVSGACDDPVIDLIVNALFDQAAIQALMEDGFSSALADPDGPGPLDSPIAAAIQDALAGVSIAGAVGDALVSQVDSAITSIVEDASGLTLAAETAIYSLNPAPGAPDLPATYTVAETAPSFGPLTPGGLPYGMAFGIPTSLLNALIASQIENGLLQSEITEFSGLPLTTGIFGLFIPELQPFPPSTPMVIKIRPTLAPVFTGAPGPSGEFAEMKIAALAVDMEFVQTNDVFMSLEVSMDAGVDLLFTQAGLEFSLATPAGQDIDMAVVHNDLGTNESNLIFAFQQLFPIFAPELENAVEAFPIPSLLGLELTPVELTRLAGGYIGLFADLTEPPTTKIQNVVITDQSSGDYREAGGCWLREWRHRLSSISSTSDITANMGAMLGADAGCTTNDASSSAKIKYQIAFDVVAVAGQQWTLDIDHDILGALERISDGYNDGIGFQDGGGTASIVTDVKGSYQIAGGASGSFDFTAGPTTTISDGIGGSSSDQRNIEFSGTNGVTLNGTTSESIVLTFEVDLDTFSNSNTAFPTANGDEMGIRLGKNDTIDSNFSVGGYPGAGGRDLVADGHDATVVLTVTPIP